MKHIKIIAGIWTVAICAIWSCNDDVEVKEKPVIAITTQPAATTNVTAGSITGSLSMSASVTQDATLSYQWYSNTTNSNTGGSEISDATSANFTIPTTLTVETYYYFCEVRATGGATSVRSNVATVNVQATVPVITINGQPAATTSVTVGSITGSLSVSASVTQSATLSYQWYSNTASSNTGGTLISGATSASFTIPTTLTAGTYYYFCEVSATGGATSVRSGVATVNVQATVPVIAINDQPAATTNVTTGSITGSLSVSASVTQGETLSYQWYSNTTYSNTDGSEISGATSASFTIPATLAAGTYYYFCVVNATGGVTSVRSNVATVHVHSAIEMVSVQGGTFIMGESGNYNGEVTLSDFSIGKYEVMQMQWVAVMGSWPDTAHAPSSSYGIGDNYPAYYVSWNDIVGTSGASEVINGITYYANGFIYKLNQLTGKKYRLPTEAEWEFAARGGNQSHGYTYSGSNTIGDVAWYRDNSNPNGTKPVGTKAHNELGIYDMSGNVWEWCSDWFDSYTTDGKTNPTGPAMGSFRVARGGSWYNGATSFRVASRSIYYPDGRANNLGFRLALAL